MISDAHAQPTLFIVTDPLFCVWVGLFALVIIINSWELKPSSKMKAEKWRPQWRNDWQVAKRDQFPKQFSLIECNNHKK